MINAPKKEDQPIIDTVMQSGQDHIFKWWESLSNASRQRLIDQIRSIDFEQVRHFQRLLEHQAVKKTPVHMEPPETVPLPFDETSRLARTEAGEVGEQAIRNGRTGIFTVAGGQGTRLGYNGPKGSFPCSPITQKSLFELQAERILANRQAYGVTIPWYIMTSPANDVPTRAFFRQHGYFGLGEDTVRFACQRMLPALDDAGKLILEARDHLAMSPNGHGGTFLAMQDGGVLEDADHRGVDIFSYYQVDNILIHVLDPVFIGFHLNAGADMSSKMVRKSSAKEKVGHFGLIDHRLHVVEYSDMTNADMEARNPDGSLKYNAGSIGIHLIQKTFVRELLHDGGALPYHIAHKKIPKLLEDGTLLRPDQPSGYKFEMFIFDALPKTRESVILEVRREEEFSPIKNREGADSPQTAKQDLNNYFGRWLEAAGHEIPRDKAGNVQCDIEIHPLYARTLEEFVRKAPEKITITDRIMFHPDSESSKG